MEAEHGRISGKVCKVQSDHNSQSMCTDSVQVESQRVVSHKKTNLKKKKGGWCQSLTALPSWISKRCTCMWKLTGLYRPFPETGANLSSICNQLFALYHVPCIFTRYESGSSRSTLASIRENSARLEAFVECKVLKLQSTQTTSYNQHILQSTHFTINKGIIPWIAVILL